MTNTMSIWSRVQSNDFASCSCRCSALASGLPQRSEPAAHSSCRPRGLAAKVQSCSPSSAHIIWPIEAYTFHAHLM